MRFLVALLAIPLFGQIDYPTQVVRTPALDSRKYLFTRTSGAGATGSLASAGSNSITLTRCPVGLNGTDTGHYLYVSGGTGTAEAVLITGGTCTSGASSGTVIFTTANTHTGSWSITSATCGLAEAQWTFTSTGGHIEAPGGNCTLYGPFYKRAIPVYIEGQGEDVTTFTVATSFPLTAVGVFAMPDDLALYNTGYLRSGGFANFTVAFTQPDSTNIALYTHWPPAIYGFKTSRPLIRSVKALRAWDFAVFNGYNGIDSYDCKASFFHHGINLDSMVDSSRIYNFEAWDFGITLNQSDVMHYNTSVYTFYIGRADDLTVFKGSSVTNFAYIYSGTGLLPGNAWATFIGCDMDAGGFFMASVGGRASIANSTIGGTTKTAVLAERFPVKYTGGELNISNSWIGFGDGVSLNSASLIDIDFTLSASTVDSGYARVNLTDNRLFLAGGMDRVFVNVHTTGSNTGTVTMNGTTLIYPGSLSAALTNPIIKAIGPVKVVAVGNPFSDKFSGLGYIFQADTDYGHVFVGNSAPGWSLSAPTASASCTFRDNTGLLNPVVFGSDVVAAGSITPTGRFFRITGTTLIGTISPVAVMGVTAVNLSEITTMPVDAFTWNTSGNLASSGTAIVGKAITWTYNTTTTKWYPSY